MDHCGINGEKGQPVNPATTTSHWHSVSAFFANQESAREAMLAILKEGVPRDLIEFALPDDVLEERDRLAHPFGGEAHEAVPALQIQLIGLDVAGGSALDAGTRVGRQFRFERGGDLQRHV